MPADRSLVDVAIEAHGGQGRWESAEGVVVRVSAGGFAFRSKLQGPATFEARVLTSGQQVEVRPWKELGQRGLFDSGSVRIESDDGQLLAERAEPRLAFSSIRHRFWWDQLDMLYFASYALWTYVSVPFVLTRSEYAVSELEPWLENGETWRRLAVSFPADVHTHSREQTFYFDASGLLRRHDYTAEPFGSWAKAAHYCTDHRDFDGFLLPTIRRVYRRGPDNRPRARPRLVWIDVLDARAEPPAAGSDE